MKHLVYLIISLFVAFSFASCSDDTINEAWKDSNWKAYEAIRTNPDYTDVRSISKNQTGPIGVYFKVIKRGTETEHPIQTSAVQLLYSGRYPGTDSIYFNIGTKNNGVPVWKIINDSDPAFSVDYFMNRGISFAIQNMVVGDKWEIWVPYYLGFGANNLSSGSSVVIKGYSTLVYEVELIAIRRYPTQ